jgi:hypothetical protein
LFLLLLWGYWFNFSSCKILTKQYSESCNLCIFWYYYCGTEIRYKFFIKIVWRVYTILFLRVRPWDWRVRCIW